MQEIMSADIFECGGSSPLIGLWLKYEHVDRRQTRARICFSAESVSLIHEVHLLTQISITD